MKNNIKLLFSVLSLVFIFTACNKYEEGPKFSLLTKKARISGTWKLEKTIDADGTVQYHNDTERMTIEKDGTVKLTEDGFSIDRKSTRLNSSHVRISYAVFCWKKKKKNK